MIVLADGRDAVLAGALGPLHRLPFVRAQIARLHRRSDARVALALWETAALAIAASAIVLEARLVAGAIAIALLVLVQVCARRRPVPKMTIVGVQQMDLGVAVVLATGVGVVLTS